MDQPLIGALRPIQITRMSDDVVKQIRDLIVDYRLKVGNRLPSERALAQTLKASRATVSQALRILSIMGLVEIRPGSGAYVARSPETMVATSVNLMLDLDPGSLAHLTELRGWLELAGMQQAVHVADDVSIGAIAAALEHMSDAKQSASMWLAADSIFHGAIMRASKNEYLAALFEGVHAAVVSTGYHDFVERNTDPAWFRTEEFAPQQALHEQMLIAIRQRDAQAATRSVVAHHCALASHIGVPVSDGFSAALAGLQ